MTYIEIRSTAFFHVVQVQEGCQNADPLLPVIFESDQKSSEEDVQKVGRDAYLSF